ncbi:MAG: cardiolipin synthase B [Candidatus Hydrogenedentes bacterium]|nr:cardiolipin synthase B [Candidatus Hydrogenedentota bacterium]
MTILVTAVVTLLLTVVTTVLALNVRSPERKIQHMVTTEYDVGSEQFNRIMGHLLGPPLIAGNRITILTNGDEIFPPMLEAIRSAQKTVTFETHVYWSGKIGDQFADAFCERAEAGVNVHVVLDYMGAFSMDSALIDRMDECGVEVELYHPLRWWTAARINHRTHRKILVCDGVVGFIGGVGIADPWLGNARNSDEWRDTHFKVEGPVVAQLQRAFVDNWLATHAWVLHSEEYFPPLAEADSTYAQVFKSSPNEGSADARLMYTIALAAARKRIRIATAYFVPDRQVLEALVAAAKRGVDIDIIVPGPHLDVRIVAPASKRVWGELLEAGIRIYTYMPTMYHCKITVIDDLWVSVGSTNLDNRSFSLNDEANLNALDERMAMALNQQLDEDIGRSQPYTLEMWRARSWKERFNERITDPIRNQL